LGRSSWSAALPVRQDLVLGPMALYEYVCRDCDLSFELRRAMSDADRSVTCPQGHTDVRRKLSMFASVGASATSGTAPMASAGGGCCGGACGCGH
jgi:putative FmdB family regulatory protein